MAGIWELFSIRCRVRLVNVKLRMGSSLGFYFSNCGSRRGVDAETRMAYEDAVSYLSYVRANGQMWSLLGFPGCGVEAVCRFIG
jgi:hypothetical protein